MIPLWNCVPKQRSNEIDLVQKNWFERSLYHKFKLPYYVYGYKYWCQNFNTQTLEQRKNGFDKDLLEKVLNNTTHHFISLE